LKRECRHQLLMGVKDVLRDGFVEERCVFRQRALVFVFVAVRGDEISAVGRTADGDFALRAAADGTDFFALGGAIARGFALLTNRTVQAIPLDFAETSDSNCNAAGYDGQERKTKRTPAPAQAMMTLL
jgi:hypothetical protein